MTEQNIFISDFEMIVEIFLQDFVWLSLLDVRKSPDLFICLSFSLFTLKKLHSLMHQGIVHAVAFVTNLFPSH